MAVLHRGCGSTIWFVALAPGTRCSTSPRRSCVARYWHRVVQAPEWKVARRHPPPNEALLAHEVRRLWQCTHGAHTCTGATNRIHTAKERHEMGQTFVYSYEQIDLPCVQGTFRSLHTTGSGHRLFGGNSRRTSSTFGCDSCTRNHATVAWLPF